MMQIPGVGPSVRALLVVRLTGGYAVPYGVWVGVHPGDLQRAFRVWQEPEYENLRLDGALANPVPPWGTAGSPVTLAVRAGTHALLCEQLRPHALPGPWPGMAAQGRPRNTSVALQHLGAPRGTRQKRTFCEDLRPADDSGPPACTGGRPEIRTAAGRMWRSGGGGGMVHRG
jgi:hypothetical protein